MTVPEVIPFEVTEDLPSRGRLAVGASAGTGKTWTLAALATRYVAERGVPVGELLVVTFTRAAAAELRERIRTWASPTARDLEASAPGSEHPDPLVAHPPVEPPMSAPRDGAGLSAPGRLRHRDHHHHPRLLRPGPRRPGQHGPVRSRGRPRPGPLRDRRLGRRRRAGRSRVGSHTRSGQRPPGCIDTVAVIVAARGPGSHRVVQPGHQDRRQQRQAHRRAGRRAHPTGGGARRRAAAADRRRHLRRPAQPGRRAAGAGRGPPPHSVDPVHGGDDRREPGHRSRPVGRSVEGLRGLPVGDDRRRRPQAGHLQLPGRRRPQLPGRGRSGRAASHPHHQLPLRRRGGVRPQPPRRGRRARTPGDRLREGRARSCCPGAHSMSGVHLPRGCGCVR